MDNVFYRDREGNEVPVPVSNNQMLENLFSNALGRAVLKIASSKPYSDLQRMALNSFVSSFFISGFVRKNGIKLREYEKKKYTSFHDFFLRRIRSVCRPLALGKDILLSPCDCKASVYPICEDSSFDIKDVNYTVGEVLRDEKLASSYLGGWFFLLRLCVEDYHHYHYPVSGVKTEDRDIPGSLYTVNPMIHKYAKVYRENARRFTTITTASGTNVLVMEVGALGVGRIVNEHPLCGSVTQGEEMGHFEFGGSTVLVMVPKDTYLPSEDLIKNTQDGYETIVKMGECIGYENHS